MSGRAEHPFAGPGPDGRQWQRPPSNIHAGWRYTISLGPKPEYGDGFDHAPIPEGVQDRACEALKASRDWSNALADIAEAISAASDVGEFDEALSDLYDWGDRARVIIGWDRDARQIGTQSVRST